MLGASAADVQADRLAAAMALCARYRCVVVLKGSGTIVCDPAPVPAINPTGNARLATAGTGDVLAGLIAARLAQGEEAADAARNAVFEHGAAADAWPDGDSLTASKLAARVGAWPDQASCSTAGTARSRPTMARAKK